MSAVFSQVLSKTFQAVQLTAAAFLCLGAISASAQTLPQTVIQTSQVHDARITTAPDDMFIDMRVPVHQIYLGETLRVQYDVYVSSQRGQVFYDIEEPDFVKWYALEGTAPPASYASISGKSYTLEPFAVYFVTPTTMGKLPLPTLKVQVPYISSKPWITHLPRFIEVIPPPSPAPEYFAIGNVGQFELKSKLSSSSARVGDVITVQIEIHSIAPVSGIKPAPFELTACAEAFQIYPFVIDTMDEKIVNEQFKSVITGHFQLLALKPGRWEIDPFKLVAFHPRTHQYLTYATEALTVDVEAASETLNLSPARAKTLQLEAWDIVPIQLEKTSAKEPVSLMWMAVPPLILLALWGIVSGRRRSVNQNMADEKHEYTEQLFMRFERAKNAQEQLDVLKEIFKQCHQWEFSPSASETEQWLREHFEAENAETIMHAIQKLQLAKYSTQDVLPEAMVGKICAVLRQKR